MFDSLGPMELGIILLIVVMIFGVGKLPQAASSLGKAIKEFKRESKSTTEVEKEEISTRRAIKRTRRSAKPAAAIAARSTSTMGTTVSDSISALKPEPVEIPAHAA